MFTWLNEVISSSQENPLTLTHGLWFDYEGFGSSRVKLLFEALQVCREHPSLREKLILIRVVLLHRKQILSQKVLPRQRIHARKVIRPLIILHLDQ